jgi:single-strand DNA-binding protein
MNGIEAAFCGRVGSDPERKMVKGGTLALASFSVLVESEAESDKPGQWVRVSTFGDRADEVVRMLRKGDRAYLEGRLKLDTWQKDGEQKFGLNLTAWTIQPMGKIGHQRPRIPAMVPSGQCQK